MNEPKSIGTDATENSGVRIEYVKSRKMLYIYGWYDGFVGIEHMAYTLDEFCKQLGITLLTEEEVKKGKKKKAKD